MTQITDTSRFSLLPHEAGFDPIEERLRMNVRATIEAVFEEELAAFSVAFATAGATGRERLSPWAPRTPAHRHLRDRDGACAARPDRNEDGKVTEWRSKALPRYQR
jgi:putative transposase